MATLTKQTGSPPRAWGRRRRGGLVPWRARFTPTCVGTAGTWSRSTPRMTVHPHVRGDGPDVEATGSESLGSPPRAWGRPWRRSMRRRWRRFTPTCVGTALLGGRGTRVGAVHPHVRGDGNDTHRMIYVLLGSPPRAWGRLLERQHPALPWRFTPTCVGTARLDVEPSEVEAVHPHVRGDGVFSVPAGELAVGSPPRAWGRLPQFWPITRMYRIRNTAGSPPRAWGRRPQAQRHRLPPRFTPTCVGTAPTSTKPPPGAAVHPHVRGDGSEIDAGRKTKSGSPPRAWGRQRLLLRGWAVERFTPTCVGTALKWPQPTTPRPVHPHVRGDGGLTD